MSVGTATHRLKKSLMLRLAQRCGMDWCCRCGERIDTEHELSVEHVKPWLDVDPSLFWDLDNIAFSHLSCNIGAARRKRTSLEDKRKANAAWMREHYTTDKRRAKKVMTGW